VTVVTADTSVVLGTGPLGLAVMRELRSRGRAVRMVNRRGTADVPGDVRTVAADLTDPEAAQRACADADVVYHCAKPPYDAWPELLPDLTAGVVSGVESADAVLVYADNLYAYGPVEGPLTESLPAAATGPKGRARAAAARRVLDAHESGRIRATIGRASDFYGPGVRESVVGERVFERALDGRTAFLLGDPEQPHTYTYIGDFARALVTLGEHDASQGEVWHVPSAETVTTKAFVERVYEAAGRTPKLRAAPRWAVRVLGLASSQLRELQEIFYMYDRPFVVDHSKFAETFDVEVTPHERAIRETLDWFREAA
jgi:nucleoside-diphosphate-sugar epimerase